MLPVKTAELIQDTAVKAARVTVGEIDHGRTLLINSGGSVTYRDIPPKVRDHNVATVAGLVAAAEQWCSSGERATIWVGDTFAILICNDEDRRDRVTLCLGRSQQYARLEGMSCGECFDQRQIIRWLRHDMAGAGGEELTTVFRQVTFSRADQSQGHLAHGDESLCRSIEQSIQSPDDVPERLRVSVPVFAVLDFPPRYPVFLTVEIKLDNQQFIVTPQPDELRKALQASQFGLLNAITNGLENEGIDENVAAYMGSP